VDPVVEINVSARIAKLPAVPMFTGTGPVLTGIYVNWSAELVALVEVPFATVMSTVPDPTVEVALIEVLLLSVEDARTPPKLTVDETENPVPVMVVDVPPAAAP
jgi:hypothetical protein